MMVVLMTAGLGRGDPSLAALQATLAPCAQIAGPVDLGDARPGPEGPAWAERLRASLHIHVPAEPADVLHLLRARAAAGVPLPAAGDTARPGHLLASAVDGRPVGPPGGRAGSRPAP